LTKLFEKKVPTAIMLYIYISFENIFHDYFRNLFNLYLFDFSEKKYKSFSLEGSIADDAGIAQSQI
jgi:hypothetical protein